MKSKWILTLFLLVLAIPAFGQQDEPPIHKTASTPTSCGVGYFYALTTASPWTIYGPTAAGACQALNAGSGTFTALTGDATSTSTGGATEVIGVHNIPLCTSFTPTNGQLFEYTTGGTPSPCWGVETVSGAVASVANSDGTLTISPTTGSVVASIALSHANTWTGNQTSARWIASTGFDISTATTAGHYLRNNGTDYVDSAIQSADVPTLNQSTTGNATTATNLASYPSLCSGSQFSQGLSSGSNNCATPSGGTTTNALTFAATGGASPGTTFNGSAAVTVSPTTIGAAPANTNQTPESSSFSSACPGSYYVSATATATLPSSVTTGCVMNFQVANGITLTFSSGTVTYTGPTAVTGPQSITVLTDGTNWNATPMGFLNLIQASGSPYTMPAITGTFWNNTASAYSWDLPTPYSGLQICVGNYQARATAQSLIPGTGVTIYFKGVGGTAGSGTGLVSGGAAGDFICLEGTSATTYMAIGAGYGTWTNH